MLFPSIYLTGGTCVPLIIISRSTYVTFLEIPCNGSGNTHRLTTRSCSNEVSKIVASVALALAKDDAMTESSPQLVPSLLLRSGPFARTQ
ncbi:RING-type domain-containing protein [Psidium guajava]|nr:RING-type domain-containing protein [Psidium guajava]